MRLGINTSKRRVVVRESTLSASPLSFFPLKAACFKAFIASFTESMTEVDEGDKVKVNGWGREFDDSGIGQRGDLISDRAAPIHRVPRVHSEDYRWKFIMLIPVNHIK